VSPRRRGEIGFLPLVAILFFNVSGGPYGVEDAVGSLGPGLALLLLVVTPLVWSLPVSLAMAELASALPEEGGYVVRVPALPEIVTEGDTEEEALAMAQDAIELVIESRHERGEPIPDDVGDPVVRKLTVAAA
jgi:predicted RNase H-like HicB family nuclease